MNNNRDALKKELRRNSLDQSVKKVRDEKMPLPRKIFPDYDSSGTMSLLTSSMELGANYPHGEKSTMRFIFLMTSSSINTLHRDVRIRYGRSCMRR